MSKLIVGCWDCAYCGAKKIAGTIRECPNCSHPRDQDVKFYMDNPHNYVKDPDKVNRNPDWICSYCSSLNSDDAKFCTSCGASRDDSEANYLENQKKKAQREAQATQSQAGPAPQAAPSGGGGKRLLPLLLVIAAIIAVVAFIASPKSRTLKNVDCYWQRDIAVERNTELQESDWSLPAGAADVTTQREVYDYERVLDHYETKTRKVPEQVLDGYDISYNYVDLGNGYYEQQEVQTPRYRTEYRTETYKDPVYRREPIYKTKYYYTVHRWVFNRYETTSGVNDAPYFAALALPEDERESGRYEQYWVVSEGVTYNIDYSLWAQIAPQTDIQVKVQGDEIIELK